MAPWQFLTRLCLNGPADDVLEGDQSNSSGSGRISGLDLPLADLPSEDVDTGEVGGDEGDVFEVVREAIELPVAPASTNMRCRGGTKTRKFKAYVPNVIELTYPFSCIVCISAFVLLWCWVWLATKFFITTTQATTYTASTT